MTGLRYVRVRLKGANPYLEGEAHMTIDLLVDEQDVAVRKLPFFGVFGPVVADGTSPFVLRNDGVADFGYSAEDDERLAVCNIKDRPIRTGEYITFWISERHRQRDEGWPFAIAAISESADLAAA